MESIRTLIIFFFRCCAGNADMVNRLSEDAAGAGMNNVAFLTRFLLGDLNACLEILIRTHRIPEAAFFARTYLPSQISRVVGLWKTSLSQVNAKAGQSLADPAQYDNLFPGLMDAMKTEQFLAQRRQVVPASASTAVPSNWERRPVEEMKAAEQQGQFQYVAPAKDSADSEDLMETEASAASAPSGHSDAPSHRQQEPVPTPVPVPAPIPAAPPAQKTVNLLDDDDDDFKPAASSQPAGGHSSQLERDLELDLDNLELDDNVDTSEVNLDDDLLDD